MKSIIERLEKVRQRLNLEQKEFAKLGHIPNTTYNSWAKGKGRVSLEFLHEIKKYRPEDIDLDWIIMGKENKNVSDPESVYNMNQCQEKLTLAQQVIEAQKETISLLRAAVSAGVSKKELIKN